VIQATSRAEITTPEVIADESVVELSLRPQRLAEFIGQQKVKESLAIYIEAARARNEPLDHTLFYGPPGLGKTTLAYVIGNEMGVPVRATSGPAIEKPGDLVGIVTNLAANEVLFIDEIHRLNPAVEEILYPAMEDFQLDLIIGAGPAARSVKIDLAHFTLVGATTRAGLLTNPLRDRFGIPIRLNFYTVAELEQVVRRAARLLGATLTTRPEEIYRALLEATAFGARTIVETFNTSGVPVTEFIVAGGLLRNSFLMQTYSDILRMPISTIASDQGPALGSAIHAAVAAGAYPDVRAAGKAMGKLNKNVYSPNEESATAYDKLFAEYSLLHDYFGRGANDVMHRLKALRRDALAPVAAADAMAVSA